MDEEKQKAPLYAFGFVQNAKTIMTDLEHATGGKTLVFSELNRIFELQKANNTVRYVMMNGAKTNSAENAAFALFDTNLQNAAGASVFGLFQRSSTKKPWIGVSFETEDSFGCVVSEKQQFIMGLVSFSDFSKGIKFLEELGANVIPERWSYRSYKSKIPNPILRSYIEIVYQKLNRPDQKEKIVVSDDKMFVLFNSGLLDIFFHDVLLLGDFVKTTEDGCIQCKDIRMLKSLTEIHKIGFKKNGRAISPSDFPKKAKFFNKIEEVIFNPDYYIDKPYDKFCHIIKDRRVRFPEKYQSLSSTEVAKRFDDAINFSLAMVERNYKFIVPQYRPQIDKIQFLLPIYLGGEFEKVPDLALVLDLQEEIYTPETILPLDAAYQNARVIAKPDELWLNPDLL